MVLFTIKIVIIYKSLMLLLAVIMLLHLVVQFINSIKVLDLLLQPLLTAHSVVTLLLQEVRSINNHLVLITTVIALITIFVTALFGGMAGRQLSIMVMVFLPRQSPTA